jgi:hypothetical protein
VGGVPVIAAAVCPHPPLLVPEVASGAASELDDLRLACVDAVRHLVAAAPDRIVVVGSGPTPSGAEIGRGDVPLSLAIGEWLLGQHPAEVRPVDTWAPAAECEAAGRALATAPERIALLVMGDGSACRGPKAPGYDDPRAEGLDNAVADALARADAAALMALDPDLARELRCAGRAPWQVLAGAMSDDATSNGALSDGARSNGALSDGAASRSRLSDGHPTWRGELRYNAAPYGVAYFVAIMRSNS